MRIDKLKDTLKMYQAKKTKLIAETRTQAISQLKAVVVGVPQQQQQNKVKKTVVVVSKCNSDKSFCDIKKNYKSNEFGL